MSSYLPDGVTGEIIVFDIDGRVIEVLNAGAIHNIVLDKSGVYFLNLATSSGEILTEHLTEIR